MDLQVLRYFTVVAEERHLGRAAARLHMTQPPLSRAMRRLEEELGVTLFDRVRTGVEPTAAGRVLHERAAALLDQADTIQAQVRRAAGEPRLAVGSLADTLDLVGGRLVTAFREVHPQVEVVLHEFDLGDPTAGLRTGACDVALTRMPFDTSGLRTQLLARQQIGLVVRDDDPLAGAASVRVGELTGREWIRLPSDTDATWVDYWTGPATDQTSPGQALRTIQECLQAVLWNGRSTLAPVDQLLPAGLVVVPAEDRAPNDLVLVWRAADAGPLIRSFVEIAARAFARALPG
ncbi:LysR family transcriptional regulator [Kribbella sp. NPDC051587]|uniref:LysR family transcriptional regulator n=1 Tax=Kribbella sp. NPDC051587 TaxID=3364119 RepID=UPI0037BDAA39